MNTLCDKIVAAIASAVASRNHEGLTLEAVLLNERGRVVLVQPRRSFRTICWVNVELDDDDVDVTLRTWRDEPHELFKHRDLATWHVGILADPYDLEAMMAELKQAIRAFTFAWYGKARDPASRPASPTSLYDYSDLYADYWPAFVSHISTAGHSLVMAPHQEFGWVFVEQTCRYDGGFLGAFIDPVNKQVGVRLDAAPKSTLGYNLKLGLDELKAQLGEPVGNSAHGFGLLNSAYDLDPSDRTSWPEQFEQVATRLLAFKEAFAKWSQPQAESRPS